MSANAIFIIIFVIFCGILIGAGLFSKRWVKESDDFVLAGREISTLINTVGVCAIGFAGTTVTLAPGFTVQYGLFGGMAWSVVYSMCGLLLFGLLYSNFIRRSGAQTLPEFLEMRYDGATRSVVAITSVIGMCGIMANNVVSSVDNIAAFTGWNRTLITAIIFLVIIVFTFISGLWATTITDLFQITIGIVVVPSVFFLLANRFGWIDVILANWAPGAFTSDGFAGSMPGMAFTYPSLFNFIICFAAALVWGNNYYWMEQERRPADSAPRAGGGAEAAADGDAEAQSALPSFLANGDRAVVRRVRGSRSLYGFRFADVTMTLPDYDDYELTATVLLDTLASEAPALTREQGEQLFNAVMEDYADLPLKADRIKRLKQDRYFNALQVKHAYAVTCHKAQGGQWAHVYVDQGYMTDDMLTPAYLHWLYTAFTRATERLYLVNWPDRQRADAG